MRAGLNIFLAYTLIFSPAVYSNDKGKIPKTKKIILTVIFNSIRDNESNNCNKMYQKKINYQEKKKDGAKNGP